MLLKQNCSSLPPPSHIQDHIPKAVRGNVGEVLATKDQRGIKAKLLKELDLEQVGG